MLSMARSRTAVLPTTARCAAVEGPSSPPECMFMPSENVSQCAASALVAGDAAPLEHVTVDDVHGPGRTAGAKSSNRTRHMLVHNGTRTRSCTAAMPSMP